MKKLIFLITFLFAIYALNAQTLEISGNLQGVDGPLIKGMVHVQKSLNGPPIKSYTVSSDGNFNFKIEGKGIYTLQFTGVSHESLNFPVVNNGDRKSVINVKLKTYNYKDKLDKVRIIGEFNKFNFDTAVPMKKENDGTFSFEMKTDKPFFKYQLLGVHKSRSINGTQSDDYEYDNGGDYISVVKVKDGKVKIVFDPSKLIKSGRDEVVEFKNANSIDSFLYQLTKQYSNKLNELREKFVAYRSEFEDVKGFTFDFGDFKTLLENEIKEGKNKLRKKLALLYYAELLNYPVSNIDTSLAVSVFDEIAPESFLWGLTYGPFINAVSFYPDKDEYLEKVLKNKFLNDDDKARILAQSFYDAKKAKNEKEAKKIFERLKSEYGNTAITKAIERRFFTDKKIKVGVKVPSFSVKSLEDSNKVYSDKSLLGKVYLIDFWATWCAPCIMEMKSLHRAYEKYKDKNFTILSLSFDLSPKDVQKFRTKKWKMPWLHSFVKGGLSSKLAKEFEVLGIPKPVLVNEEGKIIATGVDLRGKNLDKTLSKVFGK